MDNIIKIGNFTIERKRRTKKNASDLCEHPSISLDDNGDIVKCTECNIQLSAYYILKKVTKEYHKAVKNLQCISDDIKNLPKFFKDILGNSHTFAQKAIQALDDNDLNAVKDALNILIKLTDVNEIFDQKFKSLEHIDEFK
jgi:mevalonate kinase